MCFSSFTTNVEFHLIDLPVHHITDDSTCRVQHRTDYRQTILGRPEFSGASKQRHLAISYSFGIPSRDNR